MAGKRLKQWEGGDFSNYVFILKTYNFSLEGNSISREATVRNRDQLAYRSPCALKAKIESILRKVLEGPQLDPPSWVWIRSAEKYQDQSQKSIDQVIGYLDEKTVSVEKCLAVFNKMSRHTFGLTVSYEVLKLQDAAHD